MFLKLRAFVACELNCFFSKYQENNLGIHVLLEEMWLLLPENLDIQSVGSSGLNNEA